MLVASLVSACTGDDPGASGLGPAAPVLEVSLVVDGLDRPTELFVAETFWLVAQLNGGENDQVGQVLVIDPATFEQSVLIDGLDKPTGVAFFDDDVWVMEADRLLRFDVEGLVERAAGSSPPLGVDDATIAAGPLPNNGRSEGSLSVIGGRLLFDTSGALLDGEIVAESGRLWSIDGDENRTEIASGFKHAYAQTETSEGRLLVTEMSDGRFDGEAAADALVLVDPGLDNGWPRCVATEATLERRAVEAFGGATTECASLPLLVATFPPGATPTSVVLLPWDRSTAAVALWNRAEVVAVSLETGEQVVLIDQALHGDSNGVAPRPQDLVVDGDRLLVLDHDGGRIYSVGP